MQELILNQGELGLPAICTLMLRLKKESDSDQDSIYLVHNFQQSLSTVTQEVKLLKLKIIQGLQMDLMVSL